MEGNINEKDLKNVSGGVGNETSGEKPMSVSIKDYLHPECPKCGKKMTRQGGFAFPGPDGKLHSKPRRTFCPYCGYDTSEKSIDNQKD